MFFPLLSAVLSAVPLSVCRSLGLSAFYLSVCCLFVRLLSHCLSVCLWYICCLIVCHMSHCLSTVSVSVWRFSTVSLSLCCLIASLLPHFLNAFSCSLCCLIVCLIALVCLLSHCISVLSLPVFCVIVPLSVYGPIVYLLSYCLSSAVSLSHCLGDFSTSVCCLIVCPLSHCVNVYLIVWLTIPLASVVCKLYDSVYEYCTVYKTVHILYLHVCESRLSVYVSVSVSFCLHCAFLMSFYGKFPI